MKYWEIAKENKLREPVLLKPGKAQTASSSFSERLRKLIKVKLCNQITQSFLRKSTVASMKLVQVLS